MKNRILNLAVVLFALTFLVSGCQQELLRDAETQHTATQSHKFQVVKLQDIPNVVQFIKKQTGRSDLKIPMGGKKINALAKGAIEFSELETDFILKVTKEDAVYYVFGISNAGDESTLYNFEVKEVEREVVRAELIEFASDEPFDEEYSNISNFNGKVSSYNDKKELVNISYFQEGINAECPPPSYPGSGGGGGGGDAPIEPINPNDPYNPLPSWPIGGGGNVGGGGSSGGGSEVEGGCNPNNWTIDSYVHQGGGLNGPIVGIRFINDCGKTVTLYLQASSDKSSLSPNCDDGSGVVILPGTKPKTPCEQSKMLFADQEVQNTINDLEENLPGSTTERGWKYMKDGSPPQQTTNNESHTVNLGDPSLLNGGYHTHPVDGVTMFSPQDILTLISIARFQNPNNINNGFLGLVGPNGTNYLIRFTGSFSQLQALPYQYNQVKVSIWNVRSIGLKDKLLKDLSGQYGSLADNKLNSLGEQKLFFDTLKMMGLQNLISLQKVEKDATEPNNIEYTVNNVLQNSDETVAPLNPCK